MDSRDNIEKLQVELKDFLTRLEGDLDAVLDGSHSFEDDFLDRLELRTEQLDFALRSIHMTLEAATREARVEWNAVVSEAIDSTLARGATPVVVHTLLADDLPLVPAPFGLVRALLVRTIELAVRFAGVGGELDVRTGCDGDAVALRLQVTRQDDVPCETTSVERAMRTAREVVDGLGGTLTLEPTDDSFGLVLLLPTAVRAG